ncbi:helix-turn-helix domain-containing protein [Halanaerobium congolense]|jgi:hypothetical protein|uniref:helix-turn-helix domain-containing protein n=1 Tax=Halanaerobium congolense TaxID=54121 RepID=UPI00079686F8|nr:helix-turn-helix domain-containing protein [Halanaerobium congolense]KXS38992.1 MAG: hypothetical protein AWU54_2189 [Candidatus Frackibacter sp. T328-2]SHN09648.1 Helix-turn-helix domain-containing protein [Halanaerobium congolense]
MKTAEKYKEYKGPEDLPGMLRPKDVSSYLGINATAGYDILKRSDVGSFKIGKKWLISKKEFLRWIEEQSQQ